MCSVGSLCWLHVGRPTKAAITFKPPPRSSADSGERHSIPNTDPMLDTDAQNGRRPRQSSVRECRTTPRGGSEVDRVGGFPEFAYLRCSTRNKSDKLRV